MAKFEHCRAISTDLIVDAIIAAIIVYDVPTILVLLLLRLESD